MPELPEVENIAQGLRDEILGCRIKAIRLTKPGIVRGPYRGQWRQGLSRLKNTCIKAVTRRGKRLIICCDKELSLVVQLGMTGQFLLRPPRTAKQIKHNHLSIALNSKRQVYFIDSRRFGRLWLVGQLDPADPDRAMEAAGMSRLGWEPLDLKKSEWLPLLDNKRFIKTFLLDQTRIAGLGNIYADEALFGAGIYPARRCAHLTDRQAGKLLVQIKNVLRSAIRQGGTTFSDYRNAYGDMGRFRRRLRVYQRTGEPCKKCKTTIVRMVLNGRSCHFCPRCQPKN